MFGGKFARSSLEVLPKFARTTGVCSPEVRAFVREKFARVFACPVPSRPVRQTTAGEANG